MQACNYSSMLHKKRLRHRGIMSMYRGPLSKMIDEAANEKAASMLKNVEGEGSLPEGYVEISREEARKDNPDLLELGDDDDNVYFRNKFGHVVSKNPLEDPSELGIITTALSEKERQDVYGDASLTNNASGQTFWSTRFDNETPDGPVQEEEEVDLDEAQIVRTSGKAGKLQAFSEENPHASENMSPGDLTKARRWERLNNTQFKRSSSNRFGGGSGKTSTEQQTLSDARNNVKRTSGDIQPPTNKLKYANPGHILNKRTMSFRKKR